jgi:cytochrome c oxidase subunit 1
LRFGAIAGSNPWGATGLEWTTSSPPPPDNFNMMPLVTEGPYNYNPQAAGPELEATDG